MEEMFTKDLEELKIKLKIKKMNNTLEGISSRRTEAEERINDLDDKMVWIFFILPQNKKEWKEMKTT